MGGERQRTTSPSVNLHHPPLRSAPREMGAREGGGGSTFVTTLSCGKVTARPLENQRGGEHRSEGFSFIYLGRHAAPGVLAGQW